MLAEVCVDEFAAAKLAIDSGADRLEVCSALSVGGLTPSSGLVKQIDSYISATGKTVLQRVLLRPRAGDFYYYEDEFQTILRDMEIIRSLNLASLEGWVVGFTSRDGLHLDFGLIETFLSRISPAEKVTIHRAVDVLPHWHELEWLKKWPVIDIVLSSGRAKSAEEGLKALQQLQERLGPSITVMPGSGVRVSNVKKIHEALSPQWVHCSVPKEAVEMEPSMAAFHFGAKYLYKKEELKSMMDLVHSL